MKSTCIFGASAWANSDIDGNLVLAQQAELAGAQVDLPIDRKDGIINSFDICRNLYGNYNIPNSIEIIVKSKQ